MAVLKKHVAVAMSGGVDSSVAAALLVKDGYDVIGLTMKLFTKETAGVDPHYERGCCNFDAISRAESVCQTLNISHYSIDLIDKFKEYVIENFVDEYIAGRTPNPCVCCNTFLKWGSLLKKAEVLGCDYLATGHYARIEQIDGKYCLLRAANPEKDQAYALWGIPVETLSRTLLPLGSLKKEVVREIAADLGFKSAQTPDSQEVCFIPNGDYADFLKAYRPDFFSNLSPGEILEDDENCLQKVGEHPGYPFYTVGQRKGLGGGYPEPQYVLRLVPDENRVIIGSKEKLLKKRFWVDEVNWLIKKPDEPVKTDVQIRYNSPAFPATLSISEDGEDRLQIEFEEPVEAITPGQSAVFFQEERLIGGGRIIEVLE